MDANPFRIATPGLRDNDWAHTPYDEMRLGGSGGGRGLRESSLPPVALTHDIDSTGESTPALRAPNPTAAHTPGANVMTADAIEGDEVKNGAGETLGEIVDVMIDVAAGRVAYAVLSV